MNLIEVNIDYSYSIHDSGNNVIQSNLRSGQDAIDYIIGLLNYLETNHNITVKSQSLIGRIMDKCQEYDKTGLVNDDSVLLLESTDLSNGGFMNIFITVYSEHFDFDDIARRLGI